MICGIDEAGRGPIAGPIVIAGVVLKKDLNNLNDSKKLTLNKREILYSEIVKNSSYLIKIYDSKTIDKIGLSKIYQLALEDILSNLKAKRYILDGKTNYGILGVEPIIKADSSIKEVMSASILAKVTRDNIMIKLSKKYPNYMFEKHKGYCTKEHIKLIKKYGFCDIHRRSFKINLV